MNSSAAAEGNFLARMAVASRRRVERAIAQCTERELRLRIASLPPPASPRFTTGAFHLIAEVKRRSPSAGLLGSEALSPAEQARRYAAGGAIAISVLTEPEEFAGELADVTEVARALPGVPVMRKDFLTDRYQILEARAAGAAGILLIAAMLEPDEVAAMIDSALELGMFVLVEVFDRADLTGCVPAVRAAAATATGRGRVLLGVNCRDLRTLQVDFGRFAELAPLLPREVPCVAESGIAGAAEGRDVAKLGYSMALVGTALMRSGDPAAAVQAILAAGRAAQRNRG